MTKPLEIADLIVELRRRLGLTQEQLATKLGVTLPTVNRWERKCNKPSPIALKLIKAFVEQIGESAQDLRLKYFPD